MAQEVIRIPAPEEADRLSQELDSQAAIGRASASVLIRLLLRQAIDDGMSKIAVGVDPASGQAYMRYGRREPTGRFESWDMVAPPGEFFPFLLQYILSITDLESAMPPCGKVFAVDGERRFDLHVELTVPNAFEITWDQAVEGCTTETRSPRRRSAE